MKILVLGASGMAGHIITTHLVKQKYCVDTLAQCNAYNENTILMDVTNEKLLFDFLKSNSYDVVINCIGILISNSEKRKDLAVRLNTLLSHTLERFYAHTNTKIIILSTDCVFSGNNAPYFDTTLPDGQSFYARSKALGEIINKKDLTFRMSLIGPEVNPSGIGLLNWFMQQKGEINGFSNAIWNGITTIELAKAITAAIEQNITGLFQLTPDKSISKYELLLLFKKIFNKDDIIVNKDEREAPNKTLIPSQTNFSFELKEYTDMIYEMKDWISKFPQFYKHYS